MNAVLRLLRDFAELILRYQYIPSHRSSAVLSISFALKDTLEYKKTVN